MVWSAVREGICGGGGDISLTISLRGAWTCQPAVVYFAVELLSKDDSGDTIYKRNWWIIS